METNLKLAPVIILGMHRSGTSCLAGSLQQCGLFLGCVNEKAPYNAQGNRENRSIMDLNDDVLEYSGGSWDTLPSNVEWKNEHRERRDALILGYPNNVVWGFKDPRTLVTLKGWLEGLPNARFIGTVRHPAAVAASLVARNKMSIERAISLWQQYNRRLLDWHLVTKFSLISFDSKPKYYRAKLEKLALELHLDPPAKGPTFFNATLRHSTAPQITLSASVAALYEQLLEICV